MGQYHTRTAEEALLIAALDEDEAEMDRLVDDMLPGERRMLLDALHEIESRLQA